MDKSIILKHYNILSKHYPNIDITKMGLVVLMLGVLRASMGHEGSSGTIRDYIHKNGLDTDTKQCIDFLAREILRMRKSKIDIDFWKRGDKGKFRD